MGRITGDTLKKLAEKYKYAIAVVLLGVLLMLWPADAAREVPVSEEERTVTEADNVPSELSRILSLVDGAGEVEVYLTVAQGSKTVYQTDESGGTGISGSAQSQTVILTDENRRESGLVRQVLPQVYQGAIVVCAGAEDPAVRLALTQAVARATGLGTDRISVLKRK